MNSIKYSSTFIEIDDKTNYRPRFFIIKYLSFSGTFLIYFLDVIFQSKF